MATGRDIHPVAYEREEPGGIIYAGGFFTGCKPTKADGIF